MADIPMQDDEFIKAFGEDAPSAAAMSDDEAFGLTPPAEAVEAAAAETPSGDSAEAGSAPSVVTGADENAPTDAKAVNDEANAQAGADAMGESTGSQEAAAAAGEGPGPDGSAMHEGAETAATEKAEEASGMDLDDTSDVPAEDMQKFKSWQGRLKKIEAELKSKMQALGGEGPKDTAETIGTALETAGMKADRQGDEALGEAAQEMAEQVKSGEMSAQDAMRMLAEDFGQEFVDLIAAVAKNVAGTAVDERVSKVAKDVEDVIEHINDSSTRAHFEAIYDAHPDFMEVSKDPAFQEFVKEKGAEDVVAGGTARQINRLLTQFKQAKPAEAPAAVGMGAPATEAVQAAGIDPAALDAAEGVRSGGLRLPEEPRRGSDDFAAAWDEF